MPSEIKESHANGNIPCTGIVFHSFDDNLRDVVQQSTSLPEHRKGVTSSNSSHAPVPARNQDRDCHKEVEAIGDQVTAFRKRKAETSAAVNEAETEAVEVTQVHETPPTSTRPRRRALLVPASIPQDLSDTPQRTVSRKGKEKAIHVEEERNGASDVGEGSDGEAVRRDRSYAFQLANSETRENGFSQELLESISKDSGTRAKIQAEADTPSTTNGGSRIHQGIRTEGRWEDDSNVDPDQVGESKWSAVNRPPSMARGDGYRFNAASFRGSETGPDQDDGRSAWSPGASDPGPAGSGQRSAPLLDSERISEDSGFRCGEGRNGDEVPGTNGPITPAQSGAEKRKWTTPSTGDSDRPAPKYKRPGYETEDSSSPLSRRLDRSSRNEPAPAREIEGSAFGPLPQDSHKFGERPTANRIALPYTGLSLSSGTTFTSTEEEASTQDGGCPLPRPNTTTPRLAQGSIPPPVQPRSGQNANRLRERSPAPHSDPYRPRVGFADPRREELGGRSLTTGSTSPRSGMQKEGTLSSTKATASVQTDDVPAADGSQQPFSFTAGASGSHSVASSSATSSSSQQGLSIAQLQIIRDILTERASAASGISTQSTCSGSASGHPAEILGLLRGWRGSFINVPDEILAEAGIQITRSGEPPQQASLGTAIDQQYSRPETYYSLLLSTLERSCGVLSTVSPELLTAAGLGIIPRRLRVAGLPTASSIQKSPLKNHTAIIVSASRVEASDTQTLGDGTGASAADRSPSNRSAAPPTQPEAGPSNQVPESSAQPPPSSSKATKSKTKRKDTKAKGKGDKSTDTTDQDAKHIDPDGLGDSEMMVLEALSHVFDPALDGARVGGSTGSVKTRQPSPMDTEWDDKKPDPKLSQSTSERKHDGANSSSEKNEESSGSLVCRKEAHPEGSNTTRPTDDQRKLPTSQRGGKIKQLPKKKDGDKLSTKEKNKALPDVPSPVVEAPTGPSPPGATPTEPAVAIHPGVSLPPNEQTSSNLPPTLDSRDEIMVDVESPPSLQRRDVSPDNYISAGETFGEGPIVPDDEGPTPFIPNFDVSTTGTNHIDPNPDIPPQNPEDQISDTGPTETEDTKVNTTGNSSNHAAAAQHIMGEQLARPLCLSSRPSNHSNPSIQTTPPAAPIEQPGPVPENPVQPGTSTPPHPPAEATDVDQAILGTLLSPNSADPAGSSGSNKNSDPVGEAHHHGDTSLSNADAPVQELASAFGVWTVFYDTAPSPSQTNEPGES
ncbi:hypothetical protein FRC01_009127 [Tulasnella sp. 417]|nr:hypothetical protein FRC01_009127 [Tulasnella sp. 417]